MYRLLNRLLVIASLAIVGGGCGDEKLPPTSYPGAGREMMENPALYKAKMQALKEGKDINSVKVDPPKALTAKQKKAIEAAKANPVDEREAARAKMQSGPAE